MKKEEFLELIEKHLEDSKHAIAIVNGMRKLAKNASTNKYNFSKADVQREYGTIQQFLEALPSKGFGDGSILVFRKKHGSTYTEEKTVNLKFKSETPPEQMQMEKQAPQYVPQPQQPQQAMAMPQAPQLAMGYTAVQQTEYVNLKVKEERHADTIEALAKAKKELADAQSELRQTKETNATLERKLDTIKDKYDFKIERLEANQKKFWESETGKETIAMGMQVLPQLASAFIQKGQAAANPSLGQPAPSLLSQETQIFLESMKQVPEDMQPMILELVDAVISVEGFYQYIASELKTIRGDA